jgi:hypothetical protein
VSKSLSDLANYVPDGWHLLPVNKFVPEDIVLGSYTFLPWVRTGVGAAVGAPGPGQLRATLAVAVPVQADGQADQTATPPTLAVRGPGDVIGIDERQIIRRYPLADASNAEDVFLAHIEFDRPELPWLFTPAAPAGDRLAPWLVLVVLAAGRYQLTPGRGGRPAQVSARKSELQPIDEDSWAWAHAQLIGPAATGPSIADRLTSQYGAVNLARLVCPRRLVPFTQYLACVVPAFDAGVQVGLGTGNPGTLDWAWHRAADGSDGDDSVLLPVYTSWRFGTGPSGDFESLAEKLVGMPAPWQVGRRVTDVGSPKGGLPDLAANDPGRLQTIHGPLVSPQVPNPASQDPNEAAAANAEAAGWPAAETTALRNLLNRPDVLAGTPLADQNPPPPQRPIVGPEIYARYHAAVSRLDDNRTDWLAELNLRPEHRVQAGLGTRVVQMDQEQLMQAAWAQVGAIDDANRQLRWAQLARFVGTAFHERHVKPLAFGDALAVTRRAQSRLLGQAQLTVAAEVGASSLADTAVNATFRRVTRPLGGLARLAATRRAELARLVAVDGTARDMQRVYVDLDGVACVSAAAANAVDAQRVASVLGVSPTDVPTTLLAHGKVLETQPSVPDVFTVDAVAAAKVSSASTLAATAGIQVLRRLEGSLPRDPARDPARAVGLSSLLLALEAAGGDVAQKAVELARQVHQGVDALPPPPNQQMTGIFAKANGLPDAAAARAFTPIAADLVAADWLGTPIRPSLGLDGPTLVELVRPAVTLTKRIRARLGASLPNWLPADWFDDLMVQPIMAAPVFTRAMYQALDAYSRDWLLPGLATFPQPDVVTVLVSNPGFVEAFFAGLSHEMGRELLWRGYPTDQRGTYFRRFWDATKDELAQDLHRFDPTALGTHLDPSLRNDGPQGTRRVVLLVRGELIRRYPDALVLAMLAGGRDAGGRPIFEDPAANPGTKVLAPILFHGHLAPDMVLVGFDLSVGEIGGAGVVDAGWWFVIAEHPTAPRFGLRDAASGQDLRDPLGWGDLATRLAGPTPTAAGFLDARTSTLVYDLQVNVDPKATFGADAAQTAHVLVRDPVRAAFEAKTLLGPTGELP